MLLYGYPPWLSLSPDPEVLAALRLVPCSAVTTALLHCATLLPPSAGVLLFSNSSTFHPTSTPSATFFLLLVILPPRRISLPLLSLILSLLHFSAASRLLH